MSDTSRRRLLAAFAATAAAPLTGLAASPAHAVATADVPAFPGPGGLSTARSWVTMEPLGAAHFTPVALTTPVNGPTMSDLGGASLLDGSGTYARTLHTVRRI